MKIELGKSYLDTQGDIVTVEEIEGEYVTASMLIPAYESLEYHYTDFTVLMSVFKDHIVKEVTK